MDLPEQMREQAAKQLAAQPVREVQVLETTLVQKAPAPKKRSKYGNVKVEIEGELYDSKLEYQKHMVLKDRQRRGEVGLILRQVPFRLEGGVVYKADFLVMTNQAPHFCEVWDAKGCDTRSSINKRKQVRARYGIEVRLWRREDRGAT